MPLYDFKCSECSKIEDHLGYADISQSFCSECGGVSEKQFPIPASFRFPDMQVLNKKRQRIKEPIWRYPDGHIEPVNP